MTPHDLLYSLLDAALCALVPVGVRYLNHLIAEKAHDRLWTACFRAVASVEQQFVKRIANGDKKAAAVSIAQALLPKSIPAKVISDVVEAALFEINQDKAPPPPLHSDSVHLLSLVHADEGGLPS
jgi:hypothetical protein